MSVPKRPLRNLPRKPKPNAFERSVFRKKIGETYIPPKRKIPKLDYGPSSPNPKVR